MKSHCQHDNMNVYVTIDNFSLFKIKSAKALDASCCSENNALVVLLFSLLGGTFSMLLHMNMNDGSTDS